MTTVLGNLCNSWSGRILLTATLTSAGGGYYLQHYQNSETDPFATEDSSTAYPPDDGGASDANAVENIPLTKAPDAGFDSGISVHVEDEVGEYGSPPDIPSVSSLDDDLTNEDRFYQYNIFSRQVVGPLIEGSVAPLSYYMDGVGGYWMTYVHRVQEPRNGMYKEPWRREIYSRKSPEGQKHRKTLPPKFRNRPLTPKDQRELRRMGAAERSTANGVMLAPLAARLATNVFALDELVEASAGDKLDGPSQTKAVAVVTDTGMVASHMTDWSLYAYGLKQISRGNEANATKTLIGSHGVNIVSNVLSIGAGILRLKVEMERAERTGKSNPTSYFFSFMDIARGITGSLFSSYLFLYYRREKRRKKKLGEEFSAEKKNNIFLGIFDYPVVLQDAMRTVGVMSASAYFGINLANLTHAATHLSQVNPVNVAISSGLAIIGSYYFHRAAYLQTPATFPISQKKLNRASTAIAIQTLYDFFPILLDHVGPIKLAAITIGSGLLYLWGRNRANAKKRSLEEDAAKNGDSTPPSESNPA